MDSTSAAPKSEQSDTFHNSESEQNYLVTANLPHIIEDDNNNVPLTCVPSIDSSPANESACFDRSIVDAWVYGIDSMNQVAANSGEGDDVSSELTNTRLRDYGCSVYTADPLIHPKTAVEPGIVSTRCEKGLHVMSSAIVNSDDGVVQSGNAALSGFQFDTRFGPVEGGRRWVDPTVHFREPNDGYSHFSVQRGNAAVGSPADHHPPGIRHARNRVTYRSPSQSPYQAHSSISSLVTFGWQKVISTFKTARNSTEVEISRHLLTSQEADVDVVTHSPGDNRYSAHTPPRRSSQHQIPQTASLCLRDSASTLHPNEVQFSAGGTKHIRDPPTDSAAEVAYIQQDVLSVRTCFICLEEEEVDSTVIDSTGTTKLDHHSHRSPNPMLPCCSQCFASVHRNCWIEWRKTQRLASLRAQLLAHNRPNNMACSICKTGTAIVPGEGLYESPSRTYRLSPRQQALQDELFVIIARMLNDRDADGDDEPSFCGPVSFGVTLAFIAVFLVIDINLIFVGNFYSGDVLAISVFIGYHLVILELYFLAILQRRDALGTLRNRTFRDDAVALEEGNLYQNWSSPSSSIPMVIRGGDQEAMTA